MAYYVVTANVYLPDNEDAAQQALMACKSSLGPNLTAFVATRIDTLKTIERVERDPNDPNRVNVTISEEAAAMIELNSRSEQ